MRDGFLPAAALCFALGLMLTYARDRDWLIAAIVSVATAIAGSLFVLPLEWRTQIVVACWIGAMACTVGVYRAQVLPRALVLGAAATAGCLTGATASELGRPDALAIALICALVRIPAAWAVGGGRSIVVKVLASWLLAIAVLSAGLTFVGGANAGADHLE